MERRPDIKKMAEEAARKANELTTEAARGANKLAHEVARKAAEYAEEPLARATAATKTMMRENADNATDEQRAVDLAMGRKMAEEAKKMAKAGIDASEPAVDEFIQDEESTQLTRRTFLAGLASMVGIGYAKHREWGGMGDEEDMSSYEERETGDLGNTWEISRELLDKYPWLEHVPEHDFYDKDHGIEWRKYIRGGRFTTGERQQQTETLAGGEKVFHDIGLDFYYVQRGDSRIKIRNRLKEYEEYAYLSEVNPSNRISGFNIGSSDLRAGEPIPIPLEREQRKLEDEQLLKYILLAIEDILRDGPEEYRKKVQAFIDAHGEEELMLSAFAVGRHEAGSNYAGEYALHRHEHKYNSYSYSHFHVLMRDWGLRARKKLGITEGQMMHPVNGAKVFLGFLLEKGGVWETLPIKDDTIVEFAKLYNGSAHRKNAYTQRIEGYLESGRDVLNEL